MSLSEAMQTGVSVTAVGLVIVFAVLIILMVTMMIMKKVFYNETAEKGKTEVKANANATIQTPVQNRELAKEVEDENTLIAIFASAIAASLDAQVGSIKVHSYRCIDDAASNVK